MDTTKITGTLSVQNGGLVTNYAKQDLLNDLLSLSLAWFIIGFCAGILVYHFFGPKQH